MDKTDILRKIKETKRNNRIIHFSINKNKDNWTNIILHSANDFLINIDNKKGLYYSIIYNNKEQIIFYGYIDLEDIIQILPDMNYTAFKKTILKTTKNILSCTKLRLSFEMAVCQAVFNVFSITEEIYKPINKMYIQLKNIWNLQKI